MPNWLVQRRWLPVSLAAMVSITEKIRLSDKQFAQIARALAEPRRLEILRQIGAATESMQSSALLQCHQVSAATMSHHTKELESAGLIEAVKEGKFIRFTIQRPVLNAYLEQLSEI